MRRKLKRGQIYTAHDGSKLYRQIESVQPDRQLYDEAGNKVGTVSLIYYWTNLGRNLHRCHRHTFVNWLHVRKARKTQKNRGRKLWQI